VRESIGALFAKIIEIETSIIIALKQNPFQFGSMSVMDFEFYFERAFKIMEEQAKASEESLKKSKFGGINNNMPHSSNPFNSFSIQ
jgi:hypothetical protein